MLDSDYLSLRLVRLKSAEEWANRRDGLSFLFSKGGVGKCMSGSSSRTFSSGDILVLHDESASKLRAADRGEMVFSWFSACLEHLFPLFASAEISLLQDVTEDLKGDRFYAASTPLARECHKLLEEVPPVSDLGHRGQLLRVVASILTQEFKEAHAHRAGFVRPEEHMMQVFEKLSVTEILGLSVSELAGKFGCSRRHLNRLFHQHFGFSVAALRMEMRLLKAVSSLRNPDAKVINVAEECGFNHLGLFNICFKRRFGASPGQYRKLNAPSASRRGGLFDASSACPLHANGLCPWAGGAANIHGAPQGGVFEKKVSPARALAKSAPSSLGGNPGGIELNVACELDPQRAPPGQGLES